MKEAWTVAGVIIKSLLKVDICPQLWFPCPKRGLFKLRVHVYGKELELPQRQQKRRATSTVGSKSQHWRPDMTLYMLYARIFLPPIFPGSTSPK